MLHATITTKEPCFKKKRVMSHDLFAMPNELLVLIFDCLALSDIAALANASHTAQKLFAAHARWWRHRFIRDFSHPAMLSRSNEWKATYKRVTKWSRLPSRIQTTLHKSYVISVCANPRRKEMLVSTADGVLRLCSLSGVEVRTLRNTSIHLKPWRACMYDHIIAAESVSGEFLTRVVIIDADRDSCRSILRGHTEYVNQVALQGDEVVSAGGDFVIKRWSVATEQCVAEVQANSYIHCLKKYGNLVVVWDVRVGFSSMPSVSHLPRSWAVHTDGQTVCYGCDSAVYRMDLRAPHVIEKLLTPFSVGGVYVDCNTVLAACDDGLMRVWHGLVEVRNYPHKAEGVRSFDVHWDRTFIAYGKKLSVCEFT